MEALITLLFSSRAVTPVTPVLMAKAVPLALEALTFRIDSRKVGSSSSGSPLVNGTVLVTEAPTNGGEIKELMALATMLPMTPFC